MEMVLRGMAIGGGLIIAIGAQNAFVLKQGLLGRHIGLVALTCFLCDFVLMTAGVLGVGALLAASPMLALALALGGALFLFVYGGRAFYKAFGPAAALDSARAPAVGSDSARAVFISTLAITLLNPHVYIDTLLIVGGIAGTLTLAAKGQFLVGVLMVSLLWFFGLGYGARALQSWFQSARTWRVLEFCIGGVMWWIAFELARFVVRGGLPA